MRSARRSGSDTLLALQLRRALGEPAAEDLAEQALLRLEVVVEHPLVDARPVGDGVDAGAGDALGRELAHRGGEDPRLGGLGIAVCHVVAPPGKVVN